MNFEGLIPVIQCHQIQKTLEFYQQAFRYIIINKTENASGLQWVYLKSDNTFLMLQKIDDTAVNDVNSGNIILHYYTPDITSQHQFMTARGISVGEIENTPYHVRRFFVVDPEGNTISVGENTKE